MFGAAAASTTAGPTPTIGLFFPGITSVPNDVVAGVLSVAVGDMTAYSINCQTENSDCPFDTAWYLTEGPTTASWSYVYVGESTGTEVDCTISGSSATCTTTISLDSAFTAGPDDAPPTTNTNTMTVSLANVAITDGAGLLHLTTSGPASATATGSAASHGPSGTASSSKSSSSSSSSSSAMAPIATNFASLGGAMAVVAWAVAAL